MIIIVVAYIRRITLYGQVGRIVIIIGADIDAGNGYRFGVAYIVYYLQLIVFALFNLQVINVPVFVQIEIVDLVSRIVDGFFKRLRIGTGLYKLGKLVHIKARSCVVFNGDIVLLGAVLTARRSHYH